MAARAQLRVAICGGGNGAHVAAGYLGAKADVTVRGVRRPGSRDHLCSRSPVAPPPRRARAPAAPHKAKLTPLAPFPGAAAVAGVRAYEAAAAVGQRNSRLHRAVRVRRWRDPTAAQATPRPLDAAFTGNRLARRSSWAHKGELVGRLHKVSDRPQDVIPDADVVFVAAPANAHPSILRAIAPHTRDGQLVGALYAQGGFDWAAQAALGSRVGALRAMFGLQNIPWICKAPVYGKEAKCARGPRVY